MIKNSTIGKFTSIGSNVNICIGGHPTNLVSTHPAFYSNNKAFNTYSDDVYFDEYTKSEIGNDVWIGSNSTVMNNITIGDGAIIAYGAVVTKNVLPYSIVGGIPAKHIKFRFDEEIIIRLLEIKWWELSEDFLKQHFKLFHNPVDFIDFYDKNKAYIESFRNN
jgi:acetyltransferase-like isoleucine patch superfamily enzyme